MKKKYFLVIVFLIKAVFSLSAQDKFKTALDLLQKYPREKIYILYNKSQYLAGETIWFSAFVFAGYDMSPLSTNLFVELYDSEKNLITRKLLPIFNGQSAGQIELPEKLTENVYFIRAYTKWMLNFAEDVQYIHPVEVINPKSLKKLQLQNTPWKAEAFPEGGNLIDGVECKVAVRLFSLSPLPSGWKGFITERSSTEKIAEFNSLDPNVGTVIFVPSAGHQYQLTIEDKNVAAQTINLPPVVSSGVHLEVENFNDSILYVLSFKNVTRSNYKIIGTLNNELVYAAEINKSDGVLSRFIPVADLTNGILRLTLFDGDDHVIAERLCFVKPSALKISSPIFSLKKINAQPRRESLLELQTDTTQNPYSVLIVDPGSTNSADDDNLLSALWLSNDLSRPIQNSARYFSHSELYSEDGLDAILISETWKGFNWNDIFNTKKYPVLNYLPDNYLSYKATVQGGNKLIRNETVNLIFKFPDSTMQIAQAETDSTGSFILSNVIFFDSAKVFYQINSKKRSARNITVQFEQLNKPVLYNQTFPATPFILIDRKPNEQEPLAVKRALNALNNEQMADDKYKMLEEVRVHARLRSAKEKLEKELTSGWFNGSDETIFDFINEEQHAEGYTNILEWLQGRVPGLWINRNAMGDIIPLIRGQQVSIYLDEFPVDSKLLDGFPVSEIALIKVIKGFVSGIGGGNGAILIYSRRGNMRTVNSISSLNSSTLKGYPKLEDYPMPDYNQADSSKAKIVIRDISSWNDTRDVLFWNAFALSKNNDLKIPVRFYNNDSAKQFRIIIIGFTANGLPVYYDEVMK